MNLHLDTCNAFDFAAITGREQVMNDILNGLWPPSPRHTRDRVERPAAGDLAADIRHGRARQAVSAHRPRCQPPGPEPDQDEALSVLGRYIKHLEPDGEVWRSDELRGRITFGGEIPGAFDMEGAAVVTFGEEKREGQP